MYKFAILTSVAIEMDDTDRPGFQWLDAGTVRTTYDMLLYGLDDVDYDLPLSPGCQVRVGPCRFCVLREEPDTATVLLMRERGLMPGYWLRRVVLRAAEALGRWAAMEGTR